LVERGPDSSVEVWIGYKRLILKLSKVLSVKEVEGPYMYPNQRLTLIQKWYDTRDIQLIVLPTAIFSPSSNVEKKASF
jgi:hypothetical protein